MKLLLVVMTLMLPIGVNAFPNSQCGRINGYSMCGADYGPGGNDLLLVKGPEGVERIRVQCKPSSYTWQSFGPNKDEVIDKVARTWCGG